MNMIGNADCEFSIRNCVKGNLGSLYKIDSKQIKYLLYYNIVMSELSSNRILKIYKSRNTILDLLKFQDYNVSDYAEFSINEIDAMYSNDQLDMLVSREKDERKVYVKYYLQHLNEI